MGEVGPFVALTNRVPADTLLLLPAIGMVQGIAGLGAPWQQGISKAGHRELTRDVAGFAAQ